MDMFLDTEAMKRDFVEIGEINKGADGVVTQYWHRTIKTRYLAVKTPAKGTYYCSKALQDEIRCLSQLNNCEQVVALLGHDEYWLPHGPALFLEYCEFGDGWDYHYKLRDTYGFIPEETIWKMFVDMSKGLNHIHHELSVPLIHGDFKPQNILVARPMDCAIDIPTLPNFKIADFGRAMAYSPSCPPEYYYGCTYEYAPPKGEQDMPISPAFDIWSLGASLQSFALGIAPVMSVEAYTRELVRLNQSELQQLGRFDDLVNSIQKWSINDLRQNLPVTYRPLNATPEAQRSNWYWPKSECCLFPRLPANPPQYSDSLNRWYTACMMEDPCERISAADLVKWLVPVAERQIKVIQAKRKVENTLCELHTSMETNEELTAPPRLNQTEIGAIPANTVPEPGVVFSPERSPIISPLLQRKDFSLRARRRRRDSEDSNEFRNLLKKEQKYLKGLRKLDK